MSFEPAQPAKAPGFNLENFERWREGSLAARSWSRRVVRQTALRAVVVCAATGCWVARDQDRGELVALAVLLLAVKTLHELWIAEVSLQELLEQPVPAAVALKRVVARPAAWLARLVAGNTPELVILTLFAVTPSPDHLPRLGRPLAVLMGIVCAGLVVFLFANWLARPFFDFFLAHQRFAVRPAWTMSLRIESAEVVALRQLVPRRLRVAKSLLLLSPLVVAVVTEHWKDGAHLWGAVVATYLLAGGIGQEITPLPALCYRFSPEREALDPRR